MCYYIDIMKSLFSTLFLSTLLTVTSFVGSVSATAEPTGVSIDDGAAFLTKQNPSYCVPDDMWGDEFPMELCMAELTVNGASATLLLNGYFGGAIDIQGFETVDVVIQENIDIDPRWSRNPEGVTKEYGLKTDAETLNFSSSLELWEGGSLTISDFKRGIVTTQGSVNVNKRAVLSFYLGDGAATDSPLEPIGILTPFGKSINVNSSSRFWVTNTSGEYIFATGNLNLIESDLNKLGAEHFETTKGNDLTLEDTVYLGTVEVEPEVQEEPKVTEKVETVDETIEKTSEKKEEKEPVVLMAVQSKHNNSDRSTSTALKGSTTNTNSVATATTTIEANDDLSGDEEGERLEFKEKETSPETWAWIGFLMLFGTGLSVVINSLRVRSKIIAAHSKA